MAQARIAGVNIPTEKKVKISLTYIFGIGFSRALDALAEAKVDPEKRVKDLTEAEVNKIRDIVEKKYIIEGDLKREIIGNIKRMKEIGCYRGVRHIKGLPVRGQTTKRNSRTVRGNVRKTMGSGRKPAAQKT
ncbi:MAG: 30S ribosomal protein S13 [Patescibacteria group bacterium]|nr:30S ribosomal protein S13 [Patescibacteria group bacterium]